MKQIFKLSFLVFFGLSSQVLSSARTDGDGTQFPDVPGQLGDDDYVETYGFQVVDWPDLQGAYEQGRVLETRLEGGECADIDDGDGKDVEFEDGQFVTSLKLTPTHNKEHVDVHISHITREAQEGFYEWGILVQVFFKKELVEGESTAKFFGLAGNDAGVFFTGSRRFETAPTHPRGFESYEYDSFEEFLKSMQLCIRSDPKLRPGRATKAARP